MGFQHVLIPEIQEYKQHNYKDMALNRRKISVVRKII